MATAYLEASTFHSLHTHFAHELIAGASVEQNSIGHTQIIISHTQIIISQDFKGYLKGWYVRRPCKHL
jgi:hypothetical protein